MNKINHDKTLKQKIMKKIQARRSPVRQSGPPMDDRFNEIQERLFPEPKITNLYSALDEYLKYYKSLPYEIWSKTKELYLIMAYIFDESPRDNTLFLALINLDDSTYGRELFLRSVMDSFYSGSMSNITFPIGYDSLYLISESYLAVPGMHDRFIMELNKKILEIRHNKAYDGSLNQSNVKREEEQKMQEDEQRKMKMEWEEEQRKWRIELELNRKRERDNKGVRSYIDDKDCPITYSFSSKIDDTPKNSIVTVKCPLGNTNLSFFGLFDGLFDGGYGGNGISIHASQNIPRYFLNNIGDTPYKPKPIGIPIPTYNDDGDDDDDDDMDEYITVEDALKEAYKQEMESIKELFRDEAGSSVAMCVIDLERKTIYSAIVGNSKILLIKKPKEGTGKSRVTSGPRWFPFKHLSLRNENDNTSIGLGSTFEVGSGPAIETITYEPGDTLLIGNKDFWEIQSTYREFQPLVRNERTLINTNQALAEFVLNERLEKESSPFLVAEKLIENILLFNKTLNPTLLVLYLGDESSYSSSPKVSGRIPRKSGLNTDEPSNISESQILDTLIPEFTGDELGKFLE